MKKLLVLSLLVISLLSVFALNIIYMVGDGMAGNHVLLANILEGRQLNIMKMPYTALMTTYSADSWVTDSAPAGTALFSGYKTLNRAIGILPDGKPVPSLFELAKKNGYKVGLVVTCSVTHATPAAMYGHVSNRNDETTLAEQLTKANFDVIFGAGSKYFLPESKGGIRKDGKDLIEEMKKMGYKYITNAKDIPMLYEDKVLGLFGDTHLDPASNRKPEQPTLDVMLAKALELLSKSGDDFVIMVEGSQIDWEAHANDVYGVWKETVEFDNAVKVALDYAKRNGDTLVVVLGDHETGGLSLSNGGYTIDVAKARKVKGTGAMFLSKVKLDSYDTFKAEALNFFGVEISKEEFESLKAVSNKVYRLNEIVSSKLRIGWTTHDHTAGVVPVYAFGPGAEHFTGFMDNTDVAKTVMKLMGINTLSFPAIAGGGY